MKMKNDRFIGINVSLIDSQMGHNIKYKAFNITKLITLSKVEARLFKRTN